MRECEQFLAWSLPRLGLDHEGFLRFQKPICRRVRRRCRELQLAGPAAYREYLTFHPEEWQALDGFCRLSISRFFRNRAVFDRLRDEELPRLAWDARAEGQRELRCCCIGVAAGEEPYSLRLLWDLYLRKDFPEIELQIAGLDADPLALQRAGWAAYRPSSLKELTPAEIERAFDWKDEWFHLKADFRKDVSFEQHDVRHGLPEGLWDVLLCRNLAFTFFDRSSQLRLLHQMVEALRPGGVLIIGNKESLPVSSEEYGFEPSGINGLFTLQGAAAKLVGA